MTIAATSCQKNEEQLTNSITAELTQPNSDGKTYIGTGNYLMWNSGDQIKVYDATPFPFMSCVRTVPTHPSHKLGLHGPPVLTKLQTWIVFWRKPVCGVLTY